MVAIVTNVYDLINGRSNKEYAEIVYNNFKLMSFRARFSGLIILPPPLSIISFIFCPLIIKSK